MTAQTEILTYNAGNAPAPTLIRIAGDVGEGVLIYNRESRQTCKVVGLTAANTTLENKWLEIDSKHGTVKLTDGYNGTPAYHMHDNGYIDIEPTMYIKRGISVTANDYTVTAEDGTFDGGDVGRHIRIGNGWKEIAAAQSGTATLKEAAENGAHVADIALLNRIVVTPLTAMSLDKLDIVHGHSYQ